MYEISSYMKTFFGSMYEISSCMKTFFGSMYEISSSMKTFFGSMYEISSYYDRDFLIHEIFISWRFHDPYCHAKVRKFFENHPNYNFKDKSGERYGKALLAAIIHFNSNNLGSVN